jgi:DNA-binding CsgD family transcriptional regulator
MRLLQRRDRPDELTPRQREVLELLRRGLTNEEIGRELGISADGAKFHVSQILSKLQLSSRHEAASLPSEVGARRPWWAALAPLPLLREVKWSTAASVAGAAVTAAGIVAIVVLAWGVWATSGGSSVAVERDGDACAPSVREEFLRQQALVEWDVYCPSELPDGFRLATEGDPPPDPPHLGADARPTIDMVGEGLPADAGTFVTRFVRDDGAEIVVVQGADIGFYERRDGTDHEVPRGGAMFGDISGTYYVLEPEAVIAWRDNRGKMVFVQGAGSGAVIDVAADMRPVRPLPLAPRDALLSVVDVSEALPRDAPGDWLPTSSGPVDPLQAYDCAGDTLAFPPARTFTGFSGTTWPFEDGHPPFVAQAVARYTDGGAESYMSELTDAVERCAGESTEDGVSRGISSLPYPALGDGSAAFLIYGESPVQRSETHVVAARAGEYVTLLTYQQTGPPGESADERVLEALSRIAVERLRAFAADYKPAAPELAWGPPTTEEIVSRLLDGVPADDWLLYENVSHGMRLRHPPTWKVVSDDLPGYTIRLKRPGAPDAVIQDAFVSIQPSLPPPPRELVCDEPASVTVAGLPASLCAYGRGTTGAMPHEWGIIVVSVPRDGGVMDIAAVVGVLPPTYERTPRLDTLVGEIVGIIASLEIDAE